MDFLIEQIVAEESETGHQDPLTLKLREILSNRLIFLWHILGEYVS